jgi:hypothetical protein
VNTIRMMMARNIDLAFDYTNKSFGEIAAETGIDTSRLVSISESDDMFVSLAEVTALAEACDLPVDWFFLPHGS